jgi:hypothetical protein
MSHFINALGQILWIRADKLPLSQTVCSQQVVDEDLGHHMIAVPLFVQDHLYLPEDRHHPAREAIGEPVPEVLAGATIE